MKVMLNLLNGVRQAMTANAKLGAGRLPLAACAKQPLSARWRLHVVKRPIAETERRQNQQGAGAWPPPITPPKPAQPLFKQLYKPWHTFTLKTLLRAAYPKYLLRPTRPPS